jgi:hypothetical protein
VAFYPSAVIAAVLSVSMFVAPAVAQTAATEVAGIKYPANMQLAGSQLVLNGAGVRYKIASKVYAAGLYLSQPASTPEYVIAAAGPKRMHIVMLRDIDANEMGMLLTRAIKDNVSREEFAKASTGLVRLGDMFATKRSLKVGEYFSIDWNPSVGTSVTINDKSAGEPIKEPAFYTSLLQIWLGKSPVDTQLKSALLGIKTTASSEAGR